MEDNFSTLMGAPSNTVDRTSVQREDDVLRIVLEDTLVLDRL